MANEHDLRNKKISTNVTKTVQNKKTTTKTSNSNNKKEALAFTTKTPTSTNLTTSNSTTQPLRHSYVSNAPISSRLSSANSSSALKKSDTPNTLSIVKALSEKISHFESRIEEISGLYNELKDENKSLQYVVAQLIDPHTKFAESEETYNQLKSENNNLNLAIIGLKSEISFLSTEIQQLKTNKPQPDNRPDAEQQLLNCNIVIRGAGAIATTPESELTAVYSGLRSHLGVADVVEFDPVSVKVINSNPADKKNTSVKPIQVQFRSVDAKRKFLQVRRVKKNISQIDIGIKRTTSCPILVSEELTRSNQELLFQARSLRSQGNYKFVWSCDGQVLVRYSQNSKVIRIIDTAHVNQLRAGLNLEPISDHGRHQPGASIQPSSNNSQV